MRVFIAGASGAIGARLVPQLIDQGHEVTGTFRSPGNAERVRALGAEPLALDLLDTPAVRKAASARGRARRPAAPPHPRLAHPAHRGRRCGDGGNPVPRRIQRQGQAGAWLDAPLPELAPGLYRGLRPAVRAVSSEVSQDGQSDRSGNFMIVEDPTCWDLPNLP